MARKKVHAPIKRGRIKRKGRRLKSIGLTVLALLAVLALAYMLKSSPPKFALLNLNEVIGLGPDLKIAIEATKECNKIEERYKYRCYGAIAERIGRYAPSECEKLKEPYKSKCFMGYGMVIGAEHKGGITAIEDACSKTGSSKECLSGAAILIGQESAGHIATEQCQKLEQMDAKQDCYDGIGRQLAMNGKEQGLCEKTEEEGICLSGYAQRTGEKGGREEALQICGKLDKTLYDRCYFGVGFNAVFYYNKTIEEAFWDCEQYPSPQGCKMGASSAAGAKFFEEMKFHEIPPSLSV